MLVVIVQVALLAKYDSFLFLKFTYYYLICTGKKSKILFLITKKIHFFFLVIPIAFAENFNDYSNGRMKKYCKFLLIFLNFVIVILNMKY